MMYGWRGKFLRVDLTSSRISIESLDALTAKEFIGGRGFGIHTLLNELDPHCDPLSEENVLIMGAGPLTGTLAPTGARYMVTTKSPLTGAITCSNSGGFFPTELKKAGLDMIIFKGKSSEPVYLWISDDKAELRPAGHLWGKTTHETDALVKAETDVKSRIACIGPAGEKGVLFASIMNDKHRAAGRSGVGAVMGTKNLKAVSVRGSESVPLYDPSSFNNLVKKILKKFKEDQKGKPLGLRLYGTAQTIVGTQTVGALPTRNFQQGTFDKWEDISGQRLSQTYLVKPKACFSCPIACGRGTKVEVPGYEGEGEGPEYETIFAMGSNCGIENLAALTKANYICNEQGMDTISMGATLACAMEMAEKGFIPQSIIGMGRPLAFGDADALVELTSLTAERKGFGELLSLGSRRLAAHFGRPEFAIHAKGQEFAGYEPRAEQGMGLAYATSPIGASHMRGDPAYIEILGVPTLIDPLTWHDKSLLIRDWQDVFAVIDAAGLCVFFSIRNLTLPTQDIAPAGICELLNAATGAGYTVESLRKAGERICNAERVFLCRAGFTRKDDTLPSRIVEEPLPDGPAKGFVCHLEEMLDGYYSARGWDTNGIPTTEKLRELGLPEI
jgi:aldehyde:ferredoxin oxidoreductase